MNKKLFLLFLIAASLSSCYQAYDSRTGKAPDDLIQRDTMVLILADVEIAESALREMENIGKQTGSLKEAYYHNIFTKYSISQAQFDSSMVYYRQDPRVIDKIYEDVITRLSMIESEIKLEETEKDPDQD